MRTGRKFSSKNCRAASPLERAGRERAAADLAQRRHASARVVAGRSSARAIGRQLARKVAKALAWSSAAQPSRSLQATGSSCESGNLSGPGGPGTGGGSSARPAHRCAMRLGRCRRRPMRRTECAMLPATVHGCADAARAPSLGDSGTSGQWRRTGGHSADHASLPGFGRDELPVGVARGHVAREGPHVGDVGDLVGIAVDDVAGSCRASRR